MLVAFLFSPALFSPGQIRVLLYGHEKSWFTLKGTLRYLLVQLEVWQFQTAAHRAMGKATVQWPRGRRLLCCPFSYQITWHHALAIGTDSAELAGTCVLTLGTRQLILGRNHMDISH